MRIKAIIIVQNKTQVIWEEKTENGWIENSKKNPDPIDTDFIKALEALEPDYLLLRETEIDRDLLHITGIRCTYKTEFMTLNVTILGYKTYKASRGIEKVPTPPKAAYNNTGVGSADENLLPEGCYERVKDLVRVAMDYVEQDYNQVQMEFEPPKKTKDQQGDLEDEK